MKSLKILQLTNKIPYPPADGGAIAVLSLSVGLADLGHRVTILAMNTLKHNCKIEEIPEEFTSKIKFVSVDVPAKISPLGLLQNFLFSDKPYTATRFIAPQFSNAIEHLLLDETFDVIQLEGLYLAPYIPLIRKHSKAIVAMRAHNVEHEIWERVKANTDSSLKRFYLQDLNRKLKKFEISFFDDYDILLPITQRDGKQFRSLGYRHELYTLPTGIDAQRYISDQTNTEFPGIFHLGSLDWEPNIEGLRWFLSEVWPKVLSQNDRLKLHIAGRNASEKLKDFFSVQANVIFEGEVADANAYINSKSIMIVPLLSGSGMRIKVIEGMALTKAIVSTSVGCEGITAIDGKDMMIADKPELFAEKLLALAQDKNLCQSISLNARLYIEQTFDNHSIVSRLVQKYTDFIQQHSRKKPI